MAASTTFPAIDPDRDSYREKGPKHLRADFGDGYTQATPDGLNAFEESWNLSFAGYPDTMIDQITAFLDARIDDADPFFWTPPGETATTPVKQWRLDGKYKKRFTGFQNSTLTFKIVRDFSI